MHPRNATRPDLGELDATPEQLARYRNLYLVTDSGRLDVLGEVPPLASVAELVGAAEPLEFLGATCKVISLDHLITIKESVGRPKDLLVVAELKAIRDRLRNEAATAARRALMICPQGHIDEATSLVRPHERLLKLRDLGELRLQLGVPVSAASVQRSTDSSTADDAYWVISQLRRAGRVVGAAVEQEAGELRPAHVVGLGDLARKSWPCVFFSEHRLEKARWPASAMPTRRLGAGELSKPSCWLE